MAVSKNAEKEDEWFTLANIQKVEDDSKLYCISVDSPEEQFLIGEMGVPTHNSTEEGKERAKLAGEAQDITSSIARLGRAAAVHLVVATQRPDAKLVPGETRENLHVRVNCGRTTSIASNMILGNDEGMRVKGAPKGRLYLQIHGVGDHAQGFYADPEWIDEWLDSQGKNPDGTLKSSGKLPTSALPSDTVARPEFDESVREDTKRGRYEDDWSGDLEDLIAENNA